jgi:hypothetical protein
VGEIIEAAEPLGEMEIVMIAEGLAATAPKYTCDRSLCGWQSRYGATHSLWHERIKLADIICVSDFMRFMTDPEAVKAEHKTRFKT